jgi:hypothetical protein
MKFNIYLFLLLIFLSVNLSYSQESKWLQDMKKIVPLRTTQKGVIKLLGLPSESGDSYSPRYIMKDGKFLIRYSHGFCQQNPLSVFDVAEYTVIEITFFPKKPFKPSKYKINLDGFKKTPSEDVPKAAEYDNDELGVSYFVTSKGTIEYMTFFVPDNYQNLQCPEASEQNRK